MIPFVFLIAFSLQAATCLITSIVLTHMLAGKMLPIEFAYYLTVLAAMALSSLVLFLAYIVRTKHAELCETLVECEKFNKAYIVISCFTVLLFVFAAFILNKGA